MQVILLYAEGKNPQVYPFDIICKRDQNKESRTLVYVMHEYTCMYRAVISV